jgi:glycosyltransferase involved in cell wall biosynthesis
MPKLSIILPTYNSAKFLQRIFDSLQNQIEKNLEIIFVNDGSKDNSLEICRKFATQDLRIIVKDKENGGVSSARNLGIECATGEYITFLDPDDYIDKEMYSNMLKCANSETDIVLSGFVYEYPNKSIISKVPQYMKDEYKENDVYTEVLSKFILYGKGLESHQKGTVWRMLFKREFLKKNELKFLPFVCQDDWCFALTALRNAKSVAIEKGAYYHYVIHGNSVTGKYNPKSPKDCEGVLNELTEKGVFDFIPKQYENNPNLAFFFLTFIISRLIMQKKSLFAIKKDLFEIMKWECFNVSKIHINKCNKKHKPVLFLLKLKLFLPLLLIYKLKAKMKINFA